MKIAIILSAVDKASRVINATVGKVQKSLNKFGNYAVIGGAAATMFFAKAVTAAEESEVATNRLQQVFKSMGQDYTTATRNAAAYASALQLQIGFEDEAIMAVQAKVATFEKAANATARANGIFNRATAAAFDMQAAGFGDAANNAVQLGKALNDPVKGVNALRRSGITFTDAERKKIAMLVKSNKTFEAQNMVMKAIEKQVGGVAKATVTNSQKMRLAWGEVMERIGTGLLPVVERLTNFMLNKLIPTVSKFVDEHPKLVKWLAIGAAALLAVGTAAKVVAFLFSGPLVTAIKLVGKVMLKNPILLVIAAIAFGVYKIIKHWNKIKGFFKGLWAGIKQTFKAAFKSMIFFAAMPVMVILQKWSVIKTFFANVWSGIKEAAAAAWNAIGNAITAPITWIREKWEALTSWFTKTWGKIKNFFGSLWKGIKNTATDFAMGPANLILKTQDKIAALTQRTVAVSATANPSFFNTASPAAFGNIAPMAGGKTTATFTNQFIVNGTTAADVQKGVENGQRTMLKQLEEAQRKKDRTKF